MVVADQSVTRLCTVAASKPSHTWALFGSVIFVPCEDATKCCQWWCREASECIDDEGALLHPTAPDCRLAGRRKRLAACVRGLVCPARPRPVSHHPQSSPSATCIRFRRTLISQRSTVKMRHAKQRGLRAVAYGVICPEHSIPSAPRFVPETVRRNRVEVSTLLDTQSSLEYMYLRVRIDVALSGPRRWPASKLSFALATGLKRIPGLKSLGTSQSRRLEIGSRESTSLMPFPSFHASGHALT